VTAEDFQRYLRAKRTVDDRALDRRLLETLVEGLAERAHDTATGAGEAGRPLRVLEVGAGVGTMIERLLAWDLLPAGRIEYTAVDVDPDNAAALAGQVRSWAADRPIETRRRGDGIELDDGDRTVRVTTAAAEAASFVADAGRSFDLLIGMAFLDIVPGEQLPGLVRALAPGGYWYFPITFDGGTRFGPAHPADDAVERYYHAHMDDKPGGDSHAGQHALERLTGMADAEVLGVAGSDWAVYPSHGGDSDASDEREGYPGDEAYFLRYVLGTIETALGELDRGDDLDEATLSDWLRTRRRQVDDGRLVYLTHQLDLLGRRPARG
jgi:hypothetical protein